MKEYEFEVVLDDVGEYSDHTHNFVKSLKDVRASNVFFQVDRGVCTVRFFQENESLGEVVKKVFDRIATASLVAKSFSVQDLTNSKFCDQS
jgi:hypothetical protein